MLLRLKSLLVVSFAIIGVGIVACSSSSTVSPTVISATPPPSPTPTNPRALLQEAGKVMEDLTSFAFRLEHRSGVTPLPLGIALEEAEGEVVKPDKIATRFGGTLGRIYIKFSLITIGSESFMTNPVSGRWETVAPDVSPLGFFNPSEGIAAIMSQVEDPVLISSNSDEYRINGKLPAEALSPLLGDTVTGTTVNVELKIDSEELFLIEAVIEGRVTETEPDGVVRVIKLSRFNEPITINPPQ